VSLIVGNLGPATFGLDDNALVLVDAHGHQELPRADKLSLARALVADIATRLSALEAQSTAVASEVRPAATVVQALAEPKR